MPFGLLGAGIGIAAGASGIGGLTVASGALIGLAAGGAASSAFGPLTGGPSAGQVSGTQLGEQQTVFGEQQYYANQLQQLIANPSSVTSLPGYQQMFTEGERAVSEQMGPGGYVGSGTQAISLLNAGANLENSFYTQQVNMLAQLSGLTAPSSPSQLGSNAITGQTSQANQFNNLLYQLGILGSKSGLFSSAGTPASSTTPNTGNQGTGVQLGWTGGMGPPVP